MLWGMVTRNILVRGLGQKPGRKDSTRFLQQQQQQQQQTNKQP
jgi:hypothetical protein